MSPAETAQLVEFRHRFPGLTWPQIVILFPDGRGGTMAAREWRLRRLYKVATGQSPPARKRGRIAGPYWRLPTAIPNASREARP